MVTVTGVPSSFTFVPLTEIKEVLVLGDAGDTVMKPDVTKVWLVFSVAVILMDSAFV